MTPENPIPGHKKRSRQVNRRYVYVKGIHKPKFVYFALTSIILTGVRVCLSVCLSPINLCLTILSIEFGVDLLDVSTGPCRQCSRAVVNILAS